MAVIPLWGQPSQAVKSDKQIQIKASSETQVETQVEAQVEILEKTQVESLADLKVVNWDAPGTPSVSTRLDSSLWTYFDTNQTQGVLGISVYSQKLDSQLIDFL